MAAAPGVGLPDMAPAAVVEQPQEEPEEIVVDPADIEAAAVANLTQIKGVGEATAKKLYKARINSPQLLAVQRPERLATLIDIPEGRAGKLIDAAKQMLGA
jgi:predicted flap endonuclease-1-like 5' DNA nuclease